MLFVLPEIALRFELIWFLVLKSWHISYFIFLALQNFHLTSLLWCYISCLKMLIFRSTTAWPTQSMTLWYVGVYVYIKLIQYCLQHTIDKLLICFSLMLQGVFEDFGFPKDQLLTGAPSTGSPWKTMSPYWIITVIFSIAWRTWLVCGDLP